MPYPEFIQSFPSIDVPFPEDVVQTAVVQSDAGLVAFFTFLKDMELPPHSHGAQWGTVIEGEIEFTIGGETKTYRAGDSYSISAGVEHALLFRKARASSTSSTKQIDTRLRTNHPHQFPNSTHLIIRPNPTYPREIMEHIIHIWRKPARLAPHRLTRQNIHM